MIATGFGERDYRGSAAPEGMVTFRTTVDQTDLWIAAARDLADEARRSVTEHRAGIEAYIERYPDFATELSPVPEDPSAPDLVQRMIGASITVGIGPMAAVAGTISEAVARDLAAMSDPVFVENGGDLYLIGGGERNVGLWAGRSPLSGRVAIRVEPKDGLGICTSSGTVGPSLSFGRADAAVVISRSGALADTAATELGNRIRAREDIEPALEGILAIEGVLGAAAVIGDALGAVGEVELVGIGE